MTVTRTLFDTQAPVRRGRTRMLHLHLSMAAPTSIYLWRTHNLTGIDLRAVRRHKTSASKEAQGKGLLVQGSSR